MAFVKTDIILANFTLLTSALGISEGATTLSITALSITALSIEYCYAECRVFYFYDECQYTECRNAECNYAECHYAECHCAECLGAISETRPEFQHQCTCMLSL